MEIELRTGRYIKYDEAFVFVDALEEVKEEVLGTIETEPKRTVELLETFIAACYEKAGEIDDSLSSLEKGFRLNPLPSSFYYL